ncbi:Maf family protein [Jeotgalibacillus marinus]|uniref:dTTP/UTP pyrophosphatase n=1 Tax=Jeotgalibacillus marinus TaxID=86667 RepID=A0ABV3PZW4_9BACL
MTEIILASASPRRKELLSFLNLPFSIYPSTLEETFLPNEDPVKVVTELAKRKAENVASSFPHSLVIGCDTIVVCDEILGKPRNEEEAAFMLHKLSGRTHSVYTAVSLIKESRSTLFVERVAVTFWSLSEKDIQTYIASNDPFDKAGGYGIQSGGALFVKKIDGDYYAVMGLPIARLHREMNAFLKQ